tara:strand:- start:161 stop:436 length:276 start_codon:yes stop_codon:yes gene_type:complete
MRITKRQLRRIIRERLLEATWADSWYEDSDADESGGSTPELSLENRIMNAINKELGVEGRFGKRQDEYKALIEKLAEVYEYQYSAALGKKG